jgi:hypothetical protein
LVATQVAAGLGNYDFLNLGYSEVKVILRGVTVSSAQDVKVRVSTNNGSSFLSASGDYIGISGAGAESNLDHLALYTGAVATARSGVLDISGFNVAAPASARATFFSADSINLRILPGVVARNALRVFVSTGTITGGTIYVYVQQGGPVGPTGPAGGPWTVLAPTTSGAVNDWAPGISGHTVAFWNGGADLTPSGIVGGVSGQWFVCRNVTATKVLRFPHNTGPTASNRTQNLVTSAATPVGPGGYIAYLHNGTDWQQVGHAQGASIAWTPVDNSGAGLAFTAVQATYLMNGRLITGKFLLTYPSTASGAAASVGGLPFPVESVAPGGSGKDAYPMLTTAPVYLYVREGTSYMQFYLNNGANLTNAQATLASAYFTFSYFTT